eukprot:TRINITY_DN22554_c0_g1_i1.p2 TRINITY_DN22554_c0_g1~~TRINITY_DN22554_c0_g1_i1.p2  ORF type:complete len:149 (-),score=17.36 TRINITY_DN22554_c0_g1_i1:309-755(-)
MQCCSSCFQRSVWVLQMVSSRITLSYLADVFIFGGTLEPLSLTGAVLMLAALSVMAFARKPADATSAEMPMPATSPEDGQASAASADDETDSLASFIATEFVVEQGYQESVRQRRRAIGDKAGASPQPVFERTLIGVSTLGQAAAMGI